MSASTQLTPAQVLLLEALQDNAADIHSITRRVRLIDKELRTLPWWRYDKLFFLNADRSHLVNQLDPLLRARNQLLALRKPPPPS